MLGPVKSRVVRPSAEDEIKEGNIRDSMGKLAFVLYTIIPDDSEMFKKEDQENLHRHQRERRYHWHPHDRPDHLALMQPLPLGA